MTDLISRAAAIDALGERPMVWIDDDQYALGERNQYDLDKLAIETVPSEQPEQRWIPVKWHEITDEEREEEGYPKEWVAVFDSEMPYDEQKILVTTKQWGVAQDECYADGEYALDSGWDWIDDVIAWMPLPEPYKEKENQCG